MDQKAFEWLNENTLSYDIWERKYRFNNESFEEWLDRVSGGNADLRQLIKEKKFLFGGRTLANRGTGKKGSFSNCYSRGFVHDDLDDLMQASLDIAKTFKAQGGQGISLSKLRPKGCGINNGQFESDGIIPFMEIYNRTTESISQGGSRKGALIMSLDIWHKEAENFIKIKSEDGRIEKANLSLEIDDDFMRCVKTYYETGELINKRLVKNYNGNEVSYVVKPIELYKLMMEKAYDWAEPGCIYTDRFRNYNMMEFHPEYEIETCNPCGEQPLPKHGACNLGSINLSEFVVNPFTEDSCFNWIDFQNAVSIAVEALDTVLDENMNNHPLKEQKEMAYNYRNIGLGIMGMHDCLIKLGIIYGSEESKTMIDEIMREMFRVSVVKSSNLAEEKGRFPKYNDCVLDSEIIQNHFTLSELEEFKIVDNGLRNCSLLSIAPSGSIGTMLNVSTGCEPLFQISYRRKTESLHGEDTYYDVYAGVANEYINKFETKELPTYFNTSSSINWKDRVDMQSKLQDHVDTAISSTINLPYEATLEEIEQLYLYAWEKGLKGVTIYRDGCKRSGILSTDNTPKNDSNNENNESVSVQKLERGMIIKVDDNCVGRKRTLHTGCGTLHCEAFFDPDTGDLLETYFSKGSSGGCNQFMIGLSRMISLAARGGIDIYSIVDQLKSSGTCPSYAVRQATKKDTSKGSSCPVAIGNALLDMYNEMQDDIYEDDKRPVMPLKKTIVKTPKPDKEVKEAKVSKPKCPECGEPMNAVGGCFSCSSCSYSKCE